MKPICRLVAILLVLVIILADSSMVALAEAILTMPAALQIIEEEAFYGSTSIDKVVLSNKVTEIRSRAFANSTLTEINLPASLTYIADNAFDGPNKVTVTATAGTYAYQWAVKNGYISEEIEAIDMTVSPDMLTLSIGDTYTLSADFVPSNARENVTWGTSKKTIATVNQGTITAKAEGKATITAIAESGLSATCEVTVVRSIPAPMIYLAEQDGMGTVSLTWNSLGSGYEYLVYESIDDVLVLLSSTTYNTYTTRVASAGVHKYCVQACIQNDDDVLVSSDESAPYDVDVQFIWSFGASIEKIEQTSQDTASITWRGVSPVSYYEIAEVAGNNYTTIASNLTGDMTTISTLTQGVHRFVIRSVYNDQSNKTWTSSWSTIKTMDIVESSIISPSAPQLVFADRTKIFSTQEATAEEFDPARFQLNWEPVENANEYAVRLYYKEDGVWIIALDDTTKGNTYALSEALFENIEDIQTYRLDLISINMFEGDPHSYYFKIKKPTIDTAITINGSSNIIWNQASRNSSVRTFEIESELPWTATTDANWLTLSQNEQQLTVIVDEYNTDIVFAEVRTATISISNSINQATITITQDESTYASIEEPSLSQNPSSPTILGTSGIRFHHADGGNDLIFILYEKVGNDYTEIYRKEQVKNNYTTISKNEVGIEFKNNATYKVVLLAVYSRDTFKQYEVEDDILRSEYYFVTRDDSSFITVNGCSSYDLLLDETSKSVRISASGIYSWESDVDWLSFNTSRAESTDSSGSLSIVATENYSSSDRTGHVTVHSGSAAATITVTQMSMLPQITFPEGLSENKNSPTSLPYGYFRYETRCVTETWFKDVNNSYIEVEGLGGTSSSFDVSSDYLDTDSNIESGAKYKIVLTSGTYEKTYYVKFGSSETTNTVKIDNSVKTVSWSIPSTAYTRSITVQGDASWTATSSASWLKIAKTSGNTAKITTTITATANTTGTDRNAIVTFKCGGINVNYISVIQKANDYVDVFYGSNGESPISDEDTTHLSGKTKSYVVRVYSGANWSISSNVDWIGFDGTSFKKSSSALSDMTPNTSVKIWLSENANGNSSRTGLVTVTSGNSNYSFTVSQEPNLIEPVLNSPDLSDDYKNPSIYQYSNGDIVLNWDAVQGASYYYVKCVATVNSKLIANTITVDTDGSSTYTATVPQKWLHPEAVDYHSIIIRVYDDYDHYESNQYSFYVQNGDAVYLNGSNEPVWNNVTDLEVTNSYLVTSTTTWSAQPKANWITVTPTSGVNGDTIAIQLAQNTGSARTGAVTISSGTSSIDLTINQCAAIPEFPELIAPNYSIDKSNPTIIPANTSSIMAKWNPEPQATQYTVSLLEYSSTSAGHYVAKSRSLTKGEGQYTFNNLSLVEGQLYWVRLLRTNHKKNTATSYYFIAGASNSFVTLDGETTITYDDDARGGGTCYSVNSSGVWTAISDSSWLTIGKKYVDEDYLTKNGEDAEDYLEHYGQSGDTLYVYMFPNMANSSRTGTITVKSGTASATITFTQEKQYSVASLNSPVLAVHPSEATEISYGSLALNWSASRSGTGNYEILLYESDSRNSGYSRVYHKQDITSHSLTIPHSTFTEGKYYRLWLGSEIEDGDDYENGHYYYFIMGYQNGLSVSADVDWSQVDNGGYVSITASATGGAGSYYYAYQLLLDGVIEQQTEWETLKYYQFKPWSNGNYQVKVIAKDATEKQVSYTSNYTKDDENTISVATANHYTASLDSSYQFLDYSVLSQRSWSVISYPNWITPSANSASFSGNIRFIIAQNNGVTRIGKVEFQSNTGITSDLTITQTGSKSIALSVTEETFTQDGQNIMVSFTAAERWTASSDSSWATLTLNSGASGNKPITVQLSENTTSLERTAVITLICNGDVAQYTIHQMGKTTAQTSLALSNSYWQVSSPSAETKGITITTSGSWNISFIPSWITASVSSGSGNTDITLYCSANNEDSTRSETIVFKGGNNTQIINVSQPGNDVYASVVSFTMSKNAVNTGENVAFTVTTKYADKIQLIVDDIAYEVYSVVNSQAVFSRSFSSAGTRQIQFMPIRLNENGIISSKQTLRVDSLGTLEKPNVANVTNTWIGQDITISWGKVPNAKIYKVYVSNGTNYFEYSETEDNSITIDKKYFVSEGTYGVEIVASAPGYSQSSSGIEFTLSAPSVDFLLTTPHNNDGFETHDTIVFTVNNLSAHYIRVRVKQTDANGVENTWYLPEEGYSNATIAELYFYPDYAGSYTATVLAYSTPYIVDADEFWGASTSINFTVTAGSIDKGSIVVGDGYANQNRTQVSSLSLKTTLGVKKVDVYDNDQFLVSLDADTYSTINQSTYRRIFKYSQMAGVTEGYHDFKFVSTDRDGVTMERHFKFYAYTPDNNNLLRYPGSNDLHLRKTPVSAANAGDKLLLSDQLSIIGTYGSNLYYVSYSNGKGYIAVSDVVSEQIIDWSTYSLTITKWPTSNPSGNTMYVVPTPYNISIGWSLNNALPANMGYNAYVYCNPYDLNPGVNKPDGWKINNTPITSSSTNLSTSILNEMLKATSQERTADVLSVHLRVDVVDTRTGEVKISVNTEEDKQYLWISDRLDTVRQNLDQFANLTVMFHDMLYKGKYQDKYGVTQKGYSYEFAINFSKIYTVGVGDLKDLKELPSTRGALIAETVMKEVSKGKAIKRVSSSDFKQLLGFVGFDAQLLDAIYADYAQLATSNWLNGNSGEANANFTIFKNACKEQCDVSKFKKNFSFVKDAIDVEIMITNMLYDYIDFSAVSRSDVQAYIDSFNAAYNYSVQDPNILVADYSLKCAAGFLTMMTAGKEQLGLYLGLAYGSNYAKEKLIDFGYKMVESFVPGYKVMTSGVKQVANIFNASKIFCAGYELQAIGSSTETARTAYINYIDTFFRDPVKNYREYEKRRNAFLDLFRLELEKFNALLKQINNSEANKFIMWVFEQFGVNFEKEAIVDELVYTYGHKYYDGCWNAYYNTYIAPFVSK